MSDGKKMRSSGFRLLFLGNAEKRVRELERKLAHTAKRLNEATVLLDLQKKVQSLWEAEDDLIKRQ
ncbi:MAG: hypothetical protein Q8Q09_10315 [Deltaproteobacteria bacterium]|nr:hypothetical protein [Deltaproteobacteria bacterium]